MTSKLKVGKVRYALKGKYFECKYCLSILYDLVTKTIKNNTVKLGDKELLGHPKIVPYLYESNWQLVMENGSLTPIFSSSKCSLSP